MAKQWKVTGDGVETEDGETVYCSQYDWSTGERTPYLSKRLGPVLLAAPDMLEALEAVGVALGGLDDVGTSEAIVCNEHTAPVINAALAKVRAAIAKAKKVGV
jgi:hypothetical protein